MTEITEVPKQENSISYFQREDVQEKFKKILGDRYIQFVTTVISIISQDDKLKNCDPQSIYLCAMRAATLNLPVDPNLGFAYIIPYEKKKKVGDQWVVDKVVAQFQMGYKGFIQLSQRSGSVIKINSTDVKEGEIINYDRLEGNITFNWIQDLEEREKKKTIGYVSYFLTKTGFSQTFFMSNSDIEYHCGEYSQSYKTKKEGLRKDKRHQMALKTVIKLNLSKNAPISINDPLYEAIVADQGVMKNESFTEIEYIDNPKPIQIKSNLSEEVINHQKKSIDSCETIEQLRELQLQNKPTDPVILSFYKEKHEKLTSI